MPLRGLSLNNSNIILRKRNHNDDVNSRDNNGMTPLMLAVPKNKESPTNELISNVIRLINEGADLNAQDHLGRTALMMTVMGIPEVIKKNKPIFKIV